MSEFTAVSTGVVQHSVSLAYTVVSTKAVQKKRKSVRDNAERWSRKYPINFNKSSESKQLYMPTIHCVARRLFDCLS